MSHSTFRRYGIILFVVLLFGSMVGYSQMACGQGQLPEAQRIVFLGDSITYSGGYIACLESAILVQHPERKIEIINLGLPSETVSGLSEPGHAGGAFPRPVLEERLERILEQAKPDLIVACYGMNDGIYYPFSEERFEAFKSGIERLHKSAEAHSSHIIHLTPAYFDAHPIRERLLPAGRDQYPQPYEGYDDVLEAYSNWLLEQRDRGWEVFDVHGVMKSAVEEARIRDPNFTFASDGVHPNAAGQSVIAIPLAQAWGLTLSNSGLPDHPKANEIFDAVSNKQETLKHAWLTKTGHQRPGIPEGVPLEVAQTLAEHADKLARMLTKLRNN